MKTKRLTTRQAKIRHVLEWVLYALLICIAYVLSTVKFSSIPKPLLLIPLAVCISVSHSEMVSSVIGLLLGLMIDTSAGKLFGFNGFIIMVCTMFVSLVFLYWLRKSFVNVLCLSAAVTLVQALFDFLFFYGIWEYENVAGIFLKWYLPSMIYTIVMTVPVYFITKFIDTRFGNPDQQYIEENNENIVRE